MIWLTKLDGSPIMINDDQVMSVEVISDTILSFGNGDKLRVLESADEVLQRITHWRQRIGLGSLFEPECAQERE